MIPVRELDLSRNKVTEPAKALRVSEGKFVIAEYSTEQPHIITEGLDACKGLTIYNPDTKKGLVAHLTRGLDFGKTLENAIYDYGGDLSDSEVHIVQATQDMDTNYWPKLETLITFFKSHRPTNIYYDTNNSGSETRGIILDLYDGMVREIHKNSWTNGSYSHETSTNKPLR